MTNSRLRLVCVSAAVLAVAAVVRAAAQLPEGVGRQVTEKLCVNECHGAEKFASDHRSKSQWMDTIDDMKAYGPMGTDEELRIALSYLVARLGIPVKINTATVKQIDDAMDLEPGQAEAIVKYRELNGPFADFDALLKVRGLDPVKLKEQKQNLVFASLPSFTVQMPGLARAR